MRHFFHSLSLSLRRLFSSPLPLLLLLLLLFSVSTIWSLKAKRNLPFGFQKILLLFYVILFFPPNHNSWNRREKQSLCFPNRKKRKKRKLCSFIRTKILTCVRTASHQFLLHHIHDEYARYDIALRLDFVTYLSFGFVAPQPCVPWLLELINIVRL